MPKSLNWLEVAILSHVTPTAWNVLYKLKPLILSDISSHVRNGWYFDLGLTICENQKRNYNRYDTFFCKSKDSSEA